MAQLNLLLPLTLILLISQPTKANPVFNVISYGADPTAKWGSTKAFLTAWALACKSTRPATVKVPAGKYLVGPINFQGPCKSYMKVSIEGTLLAPTNYTITSVVRNWIEVSRVVGLSISGGVLDGRAGRLWACKLAKLSCPMGASSFLISHCSLVTVTRLTSINSALFHIVVHASDGIRLQATTIVAPGNSPNTDGIHIQYSNHVTIIGASIRTGDDCIAMGPGNSNIYIEKVSCGPGHGISIGSLANALDEPGVQNVTVKTVTFNGTQNGFRIKTWARPSNGFVTGVLFQSAVMLNVQNPIVIDQNYCPNNLNCPLQGSGIKIKDVTFNHIQGTSATRVAVKFDCSPSNPCTGIRTTGIQLTYNEDQPAISYCKNARGTSFGVVNPPSCLL